MTRAMIRYSPKFHEVDIELGCAAASELADMIERGRGEIAGDPAADPRPYQRQLEAVRVAAVPSGKVVISLDDGGQALHLTGALEYLAVLADVVRDLAAEPSPDTHVHVEYFDGHYYLAESEIGIVLRSSPDPDPAHQ
jgi:hypothetical protein